jgi:hypothetical protein
MDQTILSEPSIIIFWTNQYQDMMEWTSRILVGKMAGANEDFGSEVVGQMWLIFVQAPTTNPTQHDPHGPDDPFRTINYHLLDKQVTQHYPQGPDDPLRRCIIYHLLDKPVPGHDGRMDEQDIGWKKGWCQ